MKTILYSILLTLFGTICACNQNSPQVKNSQPGPKPLKPDTVKSSEVYFRGSGTEPFWGLEISEKKIVLNLLEDSIIVKTPIPHTINGVQNFTAEENGQKLMLNIRKGDCSDGMSDKIYPYTLKVSYQKNRAQQASILNGCGAFVGNAQTNLPKP